MIQKLDLKFGGTLESNKLEIETTPVTVFVGPNNSGKSKLLREIHQFCREGHLTVDTMLLDNIHYKETTSEFAEVELSKIIQTPYREEAIPVNSIIVGNHYDRRQIDKEYFFNILSNPNIDKHSFSTYFLQYSTLFLDGQSRMQLINDQSADDLQRPPTNSLSVLFRDDEIRKEARRILHDAFRSFFVIDPTHLGNLKIKFSDTEPDHNFTERGIHEAAVEFHSKGKHIAELSDGVKAFTGIITQVLAGDPHILMIDEPEAFLHPPLAFKLGKEISQSAKDSNKNIFISTHSANFIMGCIQSGIPVNIVRLTYLHGVPTARILPSENLLKLMRNPLLRSTGVIEGVFYESVIVTESDSDRAFYQEINERLLKYRPEYGIPNCLFINAQNKQTVHQLIRPLRELGIPAATIVDIDIIKDGGSNWTNFLSGGFVPEISHIPLGITKGRIKVDFEESEVNMKTQGGISATKLSAETKEAAENFFNQLDEYGLFVVRNGELESWLSDLGARGHSPKWLIDIFEIMGENPESPEYLKPSETDVWIFIKSIREWLLNPERKGIPKV